MIQKDVDSFLRHGQRALNLGNPKEAMYYYNQALKIEPTNIVALNKTGNIFGRLGNYEDAIACYDKVLRIEPDNLLAIINKGLAFHYLKRYEDAIACFNKALKVRPNSAIALYNKASSLVKIDRVTEALTYLEMAINKDYSYKAKAKFDIDFQEIKTNNNFKKLLTWPIL